MNLSTELKRICKSLAKDAGLTCRFKWTNGNHPRMIFKNSKGRERFVILSASPRSNVRSKFNELKNIKHVINSLL